MTGVQAEQTLESEHVVSREGLHRDPTTDVPKLVLDPDVVHCCGDLDVIGRRVGRLNCCADSTASFEARTTGHIDLTRMVEQRRVGLMNRREPWPGVQ